MKGECFFLTYTMKKGGCHDIVNAASAFYKGKVQIMEL